jgi:hypothetical protein
VTRSWYLSAVPPTRTLTIPADGDRYLHVRSVEDAAVGKELLPGKVRLTVGAMVMRTLDDAQVSLATVATEGLVWVDSPLHRDEWFPEHLRAHLARAYAVGVVVDRAEELGKATRRQLAEMRGFYLASNMADDARAVDEEILRRDTEVAVLRMPAEPLD